MVPARFGADDVLLGETGWGPVFGYRLWAHSLRIFVYIRRDKCSKGNVPMMPMELPSCWSEQGDRCCLLHCCSTAGFDAAVTSQWRSLAEESVVKVEGSQTFSDDMSCCLLWGRRRE